MKKSLVTEKIPELISATQEDKTMENFENLFSALGENNSSQNYTPIFVTADYIKRYATLENIENIKKVVNKDEEGNITILYKIKCSNDTYVYALEENLPQNVKEALEVKDTILKLPEISNEIYNNISNLIENISNYPLPSSDIFDDFTQGETNSFLLLLNAKIKVPECFQAFIKGDTPAERIKFVLDKVNTELPIYSEYSKKYAPDFEITYEAYLLSLGYSDIDKNFIFRHTPLISALVTVLTINTLRLNVNLQGNFNDYSLENYSSKLITDSKIQFKIIDYLINISVILNKYSYTIEKKEEKLLTTENSLKTYIENYNDLKNTCTLMATELLKLRKIKEEKDKTDLSLEQYKKLCEGYLKQIRKLTSEVNKFKESQNNSHSYDLLIEEANKPLLAKIEELKKELNSKNQQIKELNKQVEKKDKIIEASEARENFLKFDLMVKKREADRFKERTKELFKAKQKPIQNENHQNSNDKNNKEEKLLFDLDLANSENTELMKKLKTAQEQLQKSIKEFESKEEVKFLRTRVKELETSLNTIKDDNILIPREALKGDLNQANLQFIEYLKSENSKLRSQVRQYTGFNKSSLPNSGKKNNTPFTSISQKDKELIKNSFKVGPARNLAHKEAVKFYQEELLECYLEVHSNNLVMKNLKSQIELTSGYAIPIKEFNLPSKEEFPLLINGISESYKENEFKYSQSIKQVEEKVIELKYLNFSLVNTIKLLNQHMISVNYSPICNNTESIRGSISKNNTNVIAKK